MPKADPNRSRQTTTRQEPITAAKVHSWFQESYERGVIPSPKQCEQLAAYLNEVLGHTGGNALDTHAPKIPPNPLPGAVDTILSAIDSTLLDMSRQVSPISKAHAPTLVRLRDDLRQHRHLIEALPWGHADPSGRTEVQHVADGIAAFAQMALGAAGRRTGSDSSNTEGAFLKLVHHALVAVGHNVSPAGLASQLRRDPSPVQLRKLVSEPRPKKKPA
ncbi:MAG: hypothetical protein KGI51_08425 [Rhodospirillales bacterium]|nr:hypothetical protein [Rhodospirillales bacterium]